MVETLERFKWIYIHQNSQACMKFENEKKSKITIFNMYISNQLNQLQVKQWLQANQPKSHLYSYIRHAKNITLDGG